MIQVTFTLTERLAELTGFSQTPMTLPGGSTLHDAVHSVVDRMAAGPAAHLAKGGRLHPSILVVHKGHAWPGPDYTGIEVDSDDVIHLMLPVAGG